MLKSAIAKGWCALELEEQQGFFPCEIGTDRSMQNSRLAPREVFSSILVGTCSRDKHAQAPLLQRVVSYLQTQHKKRELLTFFEDESYPPDIDTNGLGYAFLYESGVIESTQAHAIADQILSYSKHNKLTVWMDSKRPKVYDVIAAINALYFIGLLDRQDECTSTVDWIVEELESGKYANGSRYYHSPEAFLFFLHRLVKQFPCWRDRVGKKLLQETQNRLGVTPYVLDIAMRLVVLAGSETDLRAETRLLLTLQKPDGSWDNDPLFHYGSKQEFFGSRGVSNAMAIHALECVQDSDYK